MAEEVVIEEALVEVTTVLFVEVVVELLEDGTVSELSEEVTDYNKTENLTVELRKND